MVIVSDASPIIALAVCDKLDLLDMLFDRVCIPQAVFNELAIPDKPKATEIIAWAKDKVIPVKNSTAVTALSMNLDLGESEALSLYWETDADFLLIDEKRGRIIAIRNGIKTIGTIGVLLLAKQKGVVTLVKPLLEILTRNGFRISDVLYRQILERAGESLAL
jgi:predicted nucleic acid-binding protein